MDLKTVKITLSSESSQGHKRMRNNGAIFTATSDIIFIANDPVKYICIKIYDKDSSLFDLLIRYIDLFVYSQVQKFLVLHDNALITIMSFVFRTTLMTYIDVLNQ